ncbi:unnamed protein product [Schistosoma haematobium]|nr:unnamed protein product [Schistosoma haematobium]
MNDMFKCFWSCIRREIGIKLQIIDCQPIVNGIYSSMNYFLAQVHEKFEHQIFCHTNLLELKWCLEEENDEIFSGFVLERIESDLILIIYPDSIDKLEEINSIKYQFANCLQKYFDTIETRKVIGVDCFKIQLYINNNDVANTINEWKMSIIPIVYHIEDSEKNLKLIQYAKLAQNQLFQNDFYFIQKSNEKMISLIPDFLIYLKQLQLQLHNNNNNNSNNSNSNSNSNNSNNNSSNNNNNNNNEIIINENLLNLLMNGITCIQDIKNLQKYLQIMIGQSIDPKGIRCQLIHIILQILMDYNKLINNINKQIIIPLYQITPGYETLDQINKKKIIKKSIKNLIQLLHTTNNNNNNNDYIELINNNNNDIIPASLYYYIRDENFQKYSWMLCITSSLISSLSKINFDIDEYFFSQFNCII